MIAHGSLRIHVNPLTGCWEWIGQRDTNGEYGLVSRDGQRDFAHRAVWELFVGPVNSGMTIDHVCRLHACVNPTHLEEVSLEENLRRMHEVRRIRPRSARPPSPRRAAATGVTRPSNDDDDGRTLRDVHRLLRDHSRMHGSDIRVALAQINPRYADWTPRQLAVALRSHGVRPAQLWCAGRNAQGYRYEPVAEALARLESSQAEVSEG